MFAILSNFFRFSLQGLNKSAESFSAFRCTLVNAGILENADEDLSDLFFQDIIDVFLIDVRVIRKELITQSACFSISALERISFLFRM